jgi:D-glycero-D-manno-heptose 1,7-bisphosphate phosphatase
VSGQANHDRDEPTDLSLSPCHLVTLSPCHLLKPAVFLDRDGVLNRVFVRDGVTHPPAHVGEFEFLPGVADAARRLAAVGLPLVVVTNQPDVARGIQTLAGVEALNDRVRTELPVLEVLTCCHDNADNCGCRKPKPGLLLEAARRWRLDLGRSFMVGDRWSDVEAGRAAGCRSVLVETPHSGRHRCQPDHCVRDLVEAADWILSFHGGE